VVPQPSSVSRGWPAARSAITAVREVVDLLNDEDRLLGE
jgi:retron-type reverse transcriptase